MKKNRKKINILRLLYILSIVIVMAFFYFHFKNAVLTSCFLTFKESLDEQTITQSFDLFNNNPLWLLVLFYLTIALIIIMEKVEKISSAGTSHEPRFPTFGSGIDQELNNTLSKISSQIDMDIE